MGGRDIVVGGERAVGEGFGGVGFGALPVVVHDGKVKLGLGVACIGERLPCGEGGSVVAVLVGG